MILRRILLIVAILGGMPMFLASLYALMLAIAIGIGALSGSYILADQLVAFGFFAVNGVASLTYAHRVFDGLVDYESVLASKRFHEYGASFDCTYAVVELPIDAALIPPTGSGRNEWQYEYGGDWHPTPADSGLYREQCGIEHCCSGSLPESILSRIDRMGDEPGSWVARDGHETLYIYSAPERLAARIRFGD